MTQGWVTIPPPPRREVGSLQPQVGHARAPKVDHEKSAAEDVVKYDPRDLSRVYFIPPTGGAAVPLPLANRSLGSFSMLELRRTQALTKAEHRTWSERTLPEMLQRERAALAEAEKKTKGARRDAARIRKTREAVASNATKASPANEPLAPADMPAPSTPPAPTLSAELAADDWGMPVLRFRGES